ncbi:MAG: Ni/Fe hydrogenase subunit alpha [Thermodesulfovibrionales bacterium]
MSNKIVIDPVTRIEGHSKIILQLDEHGAVADAHFHVTQFRGFEKFCEGRPFYEMPSLMARICGICPVSHLVTSAKACDNILGVEVPHTGDMLRRIMNLAQIVQSHALSFFYLSSPDLLMGMDADPAERNIVGVLRKYPDVARDGIRLRSFGQQIIEWLGGKRIHPSWVVPGGVNAPLTEHHREQILAIIPEATEIARRTLDWFKNSLENYREEIRTFGNFPTLFMGHVKEGGNLSLYDGNLRFVDARDRILQDGIDPTDYAQWIEEAVDPQSYLKAPYYKPLGYPDGIYRVGPLARLNIADGCSTRIANQELNEFKDLERGSVHSSFFYHYARLIEILYSLERIEQTLHDPDIMSKHVRAFASPNNFEGIGVAEAPRGTLIHHYRIDENGLITWANLIIATGHNSLAMNRGILQAAKHFVKGGKIEEGSLNRVEAVLRAFDPCLSCSTHVIGAVKYTVQIVGPGGEVLDSIARV